MIKQILKIQGSEELNKNTQKDINGGGGVYLLCPYYATNGEPCIIPQTGQIGQCNSYGICS